MKIILKTLKQEIYQLEIQDSNLTVYDFKQMIEIEFGFESEKLKLLYNGVVLKDCKSLNEYKIGEGCLITMSNIRIKSNQEHSPNSNITQNNLNENEIHLNNENSDIENISNNLNIENSLTPIEINPNNVKDFEKIYEADIKAENAVRYIASIMKVLCIKEPEKGKEFFKNLEEDNPQIIYLIKKNEVEFKSYLYSPQTDEDEKIYKKFFKGHLKESSKEPNFDLENINKLVQLGFSFEEAKQAYYACDKKFDSALNFLLQQYN